MESVIASERRHYQQALIDLEVLFLAGFKEMQTVVEVHTKDQSQIPRERADTRARVIEHLQAASFPPEHSHEQLFNEAIYPFE